MTANHVDLGNLLDRAGSGAFKMELLTVDVMALVTAVEAGLRARDARREGAGAMLAAMDDLAVALAPFR